MHQPHLEGCLIAIIVKWLFLMVPLVGLQCVIVVLPDHTPLPYVYSYNQIYTEQTSIWSFFELIFFLSSANKIEINFCIHIYICSLMGKRLGVFQKMCLSIHVILVKYAKI